MNDKPSDSNSEEPEFFRQEVQDYLDVLLMPAAGTAESQAADGEQPAVDDAGEERPLVAKSTPSLTMVGGTAVSAPRPRPLPRGAAAPVERPRPWAEPTRPLPLKMPAPESKPEPSVPPPKTPSPAPRAEPPPRAPAAPPSPSPESAVATPPPVDDTAAPAAPHPPSVWMDNGRPAWAQERFECLLFSVGGLTLAVPLVELGTIYPMNEELTPIFGQVDWFMGLLPVKDRNVKTVNTAKVVMPERYRDSMAERYRYVITINNVEWGLAVDTVSSAITLDPTDVRWRSERSKRPWLAGTVVEHMCALLDVSQLAAMFFDASARSKSR